MGKVIEQDNHRIEVLNQYLVLDTLSFTPGEAVHLKNCLTWARRLQDVNVLPPQVSHSPFVVEFNASGVHTLKRTSHKDNGKCEFKFSELDLLMSLIDNGVSFHTTGLEVSRLNEARRGPRGAGRIEGPDIHGGRY